ncbi:hypothetical protein SCHIN_v1c02090 [Spiroplasma chinense]|uniref:UPF0033 domain-containing protein n=1 Tax=Spiroplasma chinense TaxID=216932 RepID=A0A5B9Y412_9MOLU|nr:sulfurtransferase TusA family protein [Spiroplasma chinense]QEH61406.1 hypothetical protein SCHIN_v1c02090 [Spiroplasma chinense]
MLIDKIIEKDLREFSCPVPLIETKKIIQQSQTGQKILLKVTALSSRDNVVAMLEDKEKNYSVKDYNDYYEISFTV